MPDQARKNPKAQGDKDVPLVDHVAAHRIREMREAQGYSPESLAAAIREAAKSAPWGNRGACDAHTIRRIENKGHVPGPRVQFVLAAFFGLTVHELWLSRSSRNVDRSAA